MKYILCHELESGKHFPIQLSFNSKKYRISFKAFCAYDIENPQIPWQPLNVVRAFMKRDKYPKRKRIYNQ